MTAISRYFAEFERERQSTKFELVIHRQIARTLGIAVPASLLSTADEMIE